MPSLKLFCLRLLPNRQPTNQPTTPPVAAVAVGHSYAAPTPVSAVQVNSTFVTVRFTSAVELRAPPSDTGPCPVSPALCAWFAIDNINATAKISAAAATDVILTVPAASSPFTKVDYLHGTWPVPTLYAAGSNGLLPVAPFTVSV